MRFSIDTNVLTYSVDARDPRVAVARRIMADAVLADCILTNQAIGEFLNVARKKAVISMAEARRAAVDWSLLFPIAPTSTDQLIAASALSERCKLQFWDAVILTVSKDAGVEILLTEDLQDGADIDGVRAVDPFSLANAELLDALLTPLPETA